MNVSKEFLRILKRGIKECKENKPGYPHPENSIYHREIENAFMLLGWSVSDKELDHETSLEKGTNKTTRADFTLQISGIIKHPIEVKRPGHVSNEHYTQLRSYMRLTKTSVGLLFSDFIEILYEDFEQDAELVSVMKCELDKNTEDLEKFVELFTRSTYDSSKVIEYCKAKIRDKEITKSLEEYIRSSNIDNIVEYIKDSFKSLFPSKEVDKMLNNIITVDKQKITIELPSASEDKQEISKPRKTSTRLIKCFMIRHCDAKGLYNPKTGELTVLAGSKINDKYPEWIIQQHTQEAKNIKKRIDASRKGNTEFQDGVLCVIKDITFKSPSGASSFCAASSTNGYDEWKDENGEKIAIYRHQKIRAPK